MKLQDLYEKKESLEDLQAELKKMRKEMVEAKSGGHDELAQTLKDNIAALKDKIEDAKAMEEK